MMPPSSMRTLMVSSLVFTSFYLIIQMQDVSVIVLNTMNENHNQSSGLYDPAYMNNLLGVENFHPYNPHKMKKILLWTFGWPFLDNEELKGYPEELADYGCPEPNCMFINEKDRYPLENYSAIIVQFRNADIEDLPKQRFPNQRWIFKEIEPASYYYQSHNPYDGLFNWTYTYLRNSDVRYLYGRYQKRSNGPIDSVEDSRVQNKTKMAAWFVSHCGATSGRDFLVAELQKYFQIDVYGTCGTLSCDQSNVELNLSEQEHAKCWRMVEETYKFYFSLENCICKDYVSEKLFEVLEKSVIPVVLGGADYATVAPPHSVINVLDFATVHELAEYLTYLDSNDTAYNEYFEWKKDYRIVPYYQNRLESFCQMCYKLHHNNTPSVVENWYKFMVEDSECKSLKFEDQNDYSPSTDENNRWVPEDAKLSVVHSKFRIET